MSGQEPAGQAQVRFSDGVVGSGKIAARRVAGAILFRWARNNQRQASADFSLFWLMVRGCCIVAGCHKRSLLTTDIGRRADGTVNLPSSFSWLPIMTQDCRVASHGCQSIFVEEQRREETFESEEKRCWLLLAGWARGLGGGTW